MTQSRRELSPLNATQLEMPLPVTQKPSTVMQSFIIGSIAGAAEVAADHPLWSLKTRVQRGEPFTLNPSLLYRGIFPNMVSMVPISALQVGLNRCFQNVFLKKDTTELSNLQRLGSAFVAGVGSAFASCPTEMIMTYQGKNGGSFYAGGNYLIKQAGLSCLFNALPATAMREGTFTSCFLAVKPILKEVIQPICPNDNVASFTAGALAGIGGTVVSQSVDTIKTIQQAADPLQPITFKDAVKQHYASNGPYGFFKGGFWRGTRVVSAVVIMASVTETLETKFRNS